MLEYITLGLVVLKYVLDYVAPRTKNKWDDKGKDVMDVLPLPGIQKAAEDAAHKAGIQMPGTSKRENPPAVESRDHRTK